MCLTKISSRILQSSNNQYISDLLKSHFKNFLSLCYLYLTHSGRNRTLWGPARISWSTPWTGHLSSRGQRLGQRRPPPKIRLASIHSFHFFWHFHICWPLFHRIVTLFCYVHLFIALRWLLCYKGHLRYSKSYLVLKSTNKTTRSNREWPTVAQRPCFIYKQKNGTTLKNFSRNLL